MLRTLRIKDFAIIDFLEINFEPGLGVLSGETGAGKSIIIDALGLVLGGRAYTEYVRTGSKEARIEALFDLSDRPDILKNLRDAGIEADGEVVVSRTVALKGPNRADINGKMVPVGKLSEVTSGLVDIYGQHEHHSLLKPESHLRMLDNYAGLGELYERYRAAWRSVKDLEKRIEEAGRKEAERATRLDYLKFVVNEIDSANIQPDELELLRAERDVLRNARKLLEAAGQAHDVLYGAEDSVVGRISLVMQSLAEAARLAPRLSEIAEAVETARYSLEDAAISARDYASGIEENPQRLEEVEERLEFLGRLCKKYGGSPEAALEFRDKCAREISGLEEGEQSMEKLKQRLAGEKERARAIAEKLSEGRKKAARKMEKQVEKELGELKMKGAVFRVNFTPAGEKEGLGPEGAETAEFFISPNPGEQPKPLVRIASGGELSRIMLALKSILAEAADVPTLVFDEVDSGIGGAVAQVVGRKLRSLANNSQVLCVTHLAQIAAFAQSHYWVAKQQRDGRAVTCVRKLEGGENVEELARMLGGAEVTEATRNLAREMVKSARSRK